MLSDVSGMFEHFSEVVALLCITDRLTETFSNVLGVSDPSVEEQNFPGFCSEALKYISLHIAPSAYSTFN